MLFELCTEQETEVFAAEVGALLQAPAVVYLQGDLGAGKTTFVRALLHAIGVAGRIKSPTYTLVEPYRALSIDYFHFDLYRLGSPLELEAIGLQDYLHDNSICLIEWPEKGIGVLPEADLSIHLGIDTKDNSHQKRICTLDSINPQLQTGIKNLTMQVS